MLPQSSTQLSTLQHLNVLFADDDSVLRQNFGETLSIFFSQVFLAEDGTQAHHLFLSEKIHVVILDVDMPGMDGLAVAKEIRKIDTKVPILIMTNFKEEAQLLAAIKLHLTDYLIKPLSFEEVQNALNRCADQCIQSGNLVYHFSNGTHYNVLTNKVYGDLGEFVLTKNERLFIEALLKQKGQLIENTEFEQYLGKDAFSTAGLRNLVYRLRKKLGHDAVISVKDLGYLTP